MFNFKRRLPVVSRFEAKNPLCAPIFIGLHDFALPKVSAQYALTRADTERHLEAASQAAKRDFMSAGFMAARTAARRRVLTCLMQTRVASQSASGASNAEESGMMSAIMCIRDITFAYMPALCESAEEKRDQTVHELLVFTQSLSVDKLDKFYAGASSAFRIFGVAYQEPTLTNLPDAIVDARRSQWTVAQPCLAA